MNHGLAIFTWNQSDDFLEAVIEVALIAKACCICHFSYAFSLFQKLLRFADTTLNLELMWSQTIGGVELPDHMKGTDRNAFLHI